MEMMNLFMMKGDLMVYIFVECEFYTLLVCERRTSGFKEQERKRAFKMNTFKDKEV